MKKLILISLLFSATVFAQDPESYGNHELRLNALYLLGFKAFEVSYEKVKNPSNSFGAAILYHFGDSDDFYEKFSLTPYYRFYFLNRKDYGAKGMYVEAFTSLTNGYKGIFNGTEEDYFDISIGFGIGNKWVNRNGFTIETGAGIGRFLLGNSKEDVHPRFSISVGKRF